MLRLCLSISLLALVQFVSAQSPADWWYFGQEAGVHFTSNGPVADTNGVMNTWEGCAAVSTPQGDLLFYTDGTWVYNANHDTMPNGDSLLGNGSSTQSSVIVPYPGSSNKFYIFTVRGCTGGSFTGTSGYVMAYTVVDMTQDGGLGDVLVAQKNIILHDSSAEKCTAVLHANGFDIWVVGHQEYSTTYFAYHLASSGIVDTVVSEVGAPHNSCIGYMLASHDGNKIASVNYGNGANYIFPFDKQTGQLGVPDSFNQSFAYGVHFSPNDSLIYASSSSGVYQYQVNAANIQASQTLISSSSNFWAIAEGPDEKLYVCINGQSYLSCIQNPNEIGAACNWQDSAVYLEGRLSVLGLPNNVAPGLFLIADLNADSLCLGDQTTFSADTNNVDSMWWDFGDPSTGAANNSNGFAPSHQFSAIGDFTVTLIVWSDTISDTTQQVITIHPYPTAALGPDRSHCIGDSIVFDATQPMVTYLWHNSDTASTFTVFDDATVSITVFGFCDTVSDTVNVRFDDPIAFTLGPDTNLCEGQSLLLNPAITVETDSAFWNVSDTGTAVLTVNSSGTYVYKAGNGCGVVSDTAVVQFVPIPDSALLPPDTVNCFDNAIVLTRPSQAATTYFWSDSTSGNTFTVDTSGSFWLTASNLCGETVDTFTAIFNGEILAELGEDTMICPEDSIVLNAHWPSATYTWNTGDTADTLWSTDETFLYVVTITAGLCQTIESRRVELNDLACPALNCSLQHANVMTPNADGLNDIFRPWSNCDIRDYTLRIFNRWGIQVFESDQRMLGWDGFTNGVAAPDGAYFFEVDFNDRVVVDEDRNVYRGSFTLIR